MDRISKEELDHDRKQMKAQSAWEFTLERFAELHNGKVVNGQPKFGALIYHALKNREPLPYFVKDVISEFHIHYYSFLRLCEAEDKDKFISVLLDDIGFEEDQEVYLVNFFLENY